MRPAAITTFILILAVGASCRPSLAPLRDQPASESTAGKHWEELDVDLQGQVVRQLERLTGKFPAIHLLDAPEDSDLPLGAMVYTRRCAGCHGAAGRGDGPAAALLSDPPRDWSFGRFKYTSTPYGAKPTRDDLKQSIRRGLGDLPMPSFGHVLDSQELDAVADYVASLSQRGELLRALANAAFYEEAMDDALGDETAELIAEEWKSAADRVIEPLSPRPADFVGSAEAGRRAFFRYDCIRCHGGDGRARARPLADADDWGLPTSPSDLASGLYRCGDRPIDLYRAIHSGVTGTPMAGLAVAVADEPDVLWNLVDFILLLDIERRERPPRIR